MKPIDPNKIKTIIVGQDTHQGETGKNNEDTGDFSAYRLSEQDPTEIYLGIVADGIGGHQAGERASRLGVEVVKQHMRRVTTPKLLPQFKEAFVRANKQVAKEGKENRKLRGMGTTMTAAAIMNGRVYLAHVGDSRAYLIRNGTIRQLTVDHTWAQEAIDAGRLTADEARSHPNRNVIKRYMGIQAEMEVDFRVHHPDNSSVPASEKNQGFELKAGDSILLCSDGLSDMVIDPDILAIVKKNPPQKAAEELVLLARKRGGFDNITVVLMHKPGKTATASGLGLLRFIPILVGLVALFALAAGLAWAFIAGPLKTESTPTPLPTTETQVVSTVEPTVTKISKPTSTASPAMTATLPPSRTPTPTLVLTEEESGQATPTRLPTFTPTNTPRPIPTNTPTLEPTSTNTPVPDTGGGGGGGGGGKDKEKAPTRAN